MIANDTSRREAARVQQAPAVVIRALLAQGVALRMGSSDGMGPAVGPKVTVVDAAAAARTHAIGLDSGTARFEIVGSCDAARFAEVGRASQEAGAGTASEVRVVGHSAFSMFISTLRGVCSDC
jgi:hypothetical protein